MHDDLRTFLHTMNPPEVAAERIRVINDLVRLVTNCTAPQHGEPALESRAIFKRAVDALILPSLRDRINVPKRLLATINFGNTAELVANALKEGISINTEKTDIFVPSLTDPDLMAAVEKALGMTRLELDATTAEPTVEGAARMCKLNAMQHDTAVMAITALHVLLKQSPWHDFTITGAPQLRTELFNRSRHFSANALMFASLSSDDRLRKDVTAWVARNNCVSSSGVNYAIMHFLEFNGRSPGMYETKVDNAFRKSIREGYKRLV